MATLNVETHHIIQGAQTETEGAGEDPRRPGPVTGSSCARPEAAEY